MIEFCPNFTQLRVSIGRYSKTTKFCIKIFCFGKLSLNQIKQKQFLFCFSLVAEYKIFIQRLPRLSHIWFNPVQLNISKTLFNVELR